MSIILALMLLLQPPVGQDYAVLVEAGPKDEFLPAARKLADFHQARLLSFSPEKLDEAFAELKKQPPRFVVFVLPPEKIDADLVHDLLARACRLDADPFPDFEYGFITGKDGPAAERFVDRIQAAWKRDFGRKVALFGTWEGDKLPPPQPLSAIKAMQAEGQAHLIRAKDDDVKRKEAVGAALGKLRGQDLLLFFSHGYPHEMCGCFDATLLREANADFSGSILVNCACYNGAAGRWFAPGANGPVDKGLVARQDSVALELLDRGLVGYFAGVDPWHGPLALQTAGLVFDEGLRLGAAAHRMHCRLALDFAPQPIYFEPTAKNKQRFSGEGTINRRHNGGAMILYGDPALAPFAKNASRLCSAKVDSRDGIPVITLEVKPQLAGAPAMDFMIPQARLMNYYSVKTNDVMKELSPELYQVVALPAGASATAPWRVVSALCGKDDLPTGEPVVVVEDRAGQSYLHIVLPIKGRLLGGPWLFKMSQQGGKVELAQQ